MFTTSLNEAMPSYIYGSVSQRMYLYSWRDRHIACEPEHVKRALVVCQLLDMLLYSTSVLRLIGMNLACGPSRVSCIHRFNFHNSSYAARKYAALFLSLPRASASSSFAA